MTGSKDHLESKEVVFHDPVFDRSRTSGIFGNISSHGRDSHAGRVRRKEEALLGQLFLEFHIDQAGLYGRYSILLVDLDDFVHLREGKNDPTPGGDGSTREVGATSPGRHGDPFP